MPIYEYACTGCGHEFEKLVRGDMTPACPRCQATRLEKKLSVFATMAGSAEPAMVGGGACGTCGHPGGPGACALD